jgi:hypothetical protein
MKREYSKEWVQRFESFSKDWDAVLDALETKTETELILLLGKIGITASVKSNKTSLPVIKEIHKIRMAESWVPGMLEYQFMFRDIVKELLTHDVTKIRFYVTIEPDICDFGPFKNWPCLKYSFKYYIHKNGTNNN